MNGAPGTGFLGGLLTRLITRKVVTQAAHTAGSPVATQNINKTMNIALMFQNARAWIQANMMIAVIGGLVLIFLLFGKAISKAFKPKRKAVKHGLAWYQDRGKDIPKRLQHLVKGSSSSSRGSSKAGKGSSKAGYAKKGGGTIPFQFNKDGKQKLAWQVAGTVAASARMAKIRKNR